MHWSHCALNCMLLVDILRIPNSNPGLKKDSEWPHCATQRSHSPHNNSNNTPGASAPPPAYTIAWYPDAQVSHPSGDNSVSWIWTTCVLNAGIEDIRDAVSHIRNALFAGLWVDRAWDLFHEGEQLILTSCDSGALYICVAWQGVFERVIE